MEEVIENQFVTRRIVWLHLPQFQGFTALCFAHATTLKLWLMRLHYPCDKLRTQRISSLLGLSAVLGLRLHITVLMLHDIALLLMVYSIA